MKSIVQSRGHPSGYAKHPIVIRADFPYPAVMNSSSTRLAFVLFGTLLFALVGTGCNTANGLGKDVEKLGDKMQEKSR